MSEYKHEISEVVKKETRYIFVKRIIVFVICFVVGTALTIVTYNALVSMQTRAKLLDCTQPNGQCFQEGQERQAGVVKQLIESNAEGEAQTQRIVLAGFVCSNKTEAQTLSEFELCVKEELKQYGNN